jgi:hypothetical protein
VDGAEPFFDDVTDCVVRDGEFTHAREHFHYGRARARTLDSLAPSSRHNAAAAAPLFDDLLLPVPHAPAPHIDEFELDGMQIINGWPSPPVAVAATEEKQPLHAAAAPTQEVLQLDTSRPIDGALNDERRHHSSAMSAAADEPTELPQSRPLPVAAGDSKQCPNLCQSSQRFSDGAHKSPPPGALRCAHGATRCVFRRRRNGGDSATPFSAPPQSPRSWGVCAR